MDKEMMAENMGHAGAIMLVAMHMHHNEHYDSEFEYAYDDAEEVIAAWLYKPDLTYG